jgi:hypothetical protein
MSDLELVLTMLAEATTTEISKTTEPETFEENRRVARSGGEVAGNARKDIESRSGKSVITSQNATQLNMLVTDMIEGVSDNSGEDEK